MAESSERSYPERASVNAHQLVEKSLTREEQVNDG